MKRRGMAIIPLIAILTLGCEDPISLDPSDLAGTWTARSYSWLDKEDLVTVYDMIPDGGAFVVTLTADILNDTLGSLLKYQDDIARVQGSEAARLLAEIQAAA